MMPGLGTVVNVVAIIFGGIVGVLFGKKIPERFQETIQTGNADQDGSGISIIRDYYQRCYRCYH